VIGRAAGALLLLIFAAAPLRSSDAAALETTVSFPSFDSDLTGGSPTTLTALMLTPEGDGPFPAIVLAHGCDGLRRPDGKTLSSTYIWWARRFAAEGYIALLVDSFQPRGRRQVCVNEPDKVTITPTRERARDAQAARAYLAASPIIAKDRIGLMGWSNGGSTVLGAISEGAPGRPAQGNFAAAVAFYPGCFLQLRDTTWKPAVPTLILIGEADDWTPARFCQSLTDRLSENSIPISIHVYPEAHHAFDAPNLALRVRQGVNTRSGTATIGTNHAARDDAILRTLSFFNTALKR
jgi:dienelactone hydrolase